MTYESYIEIDLEAIKHNAQSIQKRIDSAKMMAVLKADAYGHGLKQVGKALISSGILYFAVASLYEALILRELSEDIQILIFGNVHPDSLVTVKEKNLLLSLSSKEQVSCIKEKKISGLNVFLKLNTGFNRMGFDNMETEKETICEFAKENVIKGIYSHLALGKLEEDKTQYQFFQEFISDLKEMGIEAPLHSLAESIATVDYPWSRMDMVRVGAALFGLRTARKSYDTFDLKGALRFYASVSNVREIKKGAGVGYDMLFKAPKDMKIAVISVGYADGYPRALSEKGWLLIQGKKCNILGLICMDSLIVDISHLENVKLNDKVLVFESANDSLVSIQELSTIAGTNKNEMLARLTASRVPKVYTN